jgi:nicotinate-nucleotide pyrophosphorylase (carboxylating)
MTLKEFYKIHDKEMSRVIASALKEDKVNGDVTTNLLLSGKAGSEKLNAVLLCKEDCTLAGLEIFKKVYRQIDKAVSFRSYRKDGDKVRKGTKVLEVRTSRKNLLIGERTALNFLQRMSGAATLTSTFVSRLKFKDARILHTRKTTPNFRLFETAAVKTGGGDFHRLSLGSSVMIKDNHILALGNITDVMNFLKRKKLSSGLKHKFEIEVKTSKELETVIKLGKGIIKVVMLDNYHTAKLNKAIGLLKANDFKIEVSGGINLQNFDKYQRKGIDFYSIGGLTHSYKSADFSLEF